MAEYHEGFGGEPIEARENSNGHVIEEHSPNGYSSRDEHFKAVDALVDQGVANYADAARRLEYDAQKYEDDESIDKLFAMSSADTTVTPGAAVSLKERAQAVGELMDGISAQNQLSGAQRSFDKSLKQRYKDPQAVLRGMQEKSAVYRAGRPRAVEALAKTAALREAGFSEQEVAASRAGIERNLSIVSGTGDKAVRLRDKQKDRTARTVKKLSS